jgi:hypothetical protein
MTELITLIAIRHNNKFFEKIKEYSSNDFKNMIIRIIEKYKSINNNNIIFFYYVKNKKLIELEIDHIKKDNKLPFKSKIKIIRSGVDINNIQLNDIDGYFEFALNEVFGI